MVDSRATRTDVEIPAQAEADALDTESPEIEAAQAEELAQLRTKLDDVTRAYARLQQDKDDFRRRAEREKERVLEIERGKVAMPLIEAADQLELTLAAVPQDTDCKDCQGLTTGVRLIRDGLMRQLEQNGITRIRLGERVPFDAMQHEAVETLPVADAALDGIIIQEQRAGYRQGERILRPARVSVGQFVEGGNN